MNTRSLAARALVTGLIFHLAGCATLSERGTSKPAPAPAAKASWERKAPPYDASQQASASDLPDTASGPVVAAVAETDGQEGPSAVRWTAGVVADSATAVQQGVNKVTEALTPAPPVSAGDDPLQLSNKAKPSPELYSAVARFCEQSGKPAQAERTYQQAMRLWPKHLGTALNYARFKDRQGLPQEALRLYQDAARQHPNEAAVFNDMGLFFARAGRNQEAVRAFAQAIQLQPKRPLYRNNLAALLVDMDQPDQAMSQLRAVYGEAEASYKLGYLVQKKGRPREAEALFARAIQVNPALAEARAWLQYLQGNPTASAQLARRPMPSEGAAADSLPQSPPPSIIRDARTEPQAGPRAGPRSAPGWRSPSEVRPLGPSVTPLPRVSEEGSAGPSDMRDRGGSPAHAPPLREKAEPGAAASDPPLPDDATDAPLPSDGGPRPLRPADEEAPRVVRPLPPVEK